jgi:hypothetical protein
MGTRGFSLGVKWPGSETDHSPPTSTEVKKMWVYTSTPIRLHGIVLNQFSTGTNLPFFTNELELNLNISTDLVKIKIEDIYIIQKF